VDDLAVDERIQLKWILNRMGHHGLDCFAQDKDSFRVS